MPRRTSWLPRLPEIRRSVRESVRSHYERRDLERLFHIHPRAAQKLMQMVTVGAKVGGVPWSIGSCCRTSWIG